MLALPEAPRSLGQSGSDATASHRPDAKETLDAVVLGDLRRKVNSVLGFVVTDADTLSVIAQGEMTFFQGFEDVPIYCCHGASQWDRAKLRTVGGVFGRQVGAIDVMGG